jgi:outer membrane immunogenic protein
MRKFLLLGVSATAIAVASGASAADMGVPALKALPPAPFSWTGCYIGAHVGGGFLLDNYSGSNTAISPPEYGGGWIAGGQVGCNYQDPRTTFLGGAVVVGLEADGFWSGMQHSYSSGVNDFGFAEGYNTTTKNNWDFDIAARFGLAYGQSLFYSKVGAAWGNFTFSETYSGVCSPSCYSESGSATLPGLLLGLGFEYAFLPNWTAKLEYNYIGYFTTNVNFSEYYGGVLYGESYSESYNASKQIVKIGVNYKFW